ncbi:MAG TPA: STAS domain-containing protein [Chitinophagaceae bacterium]|nr:STAS domain-containing protein [Chitinophagaceae bacterium]
MKSTASQILAKKQNEILDLWMKQQLKDEGLRDDLITSDDLKRDSSELLNVLLGAIKKDNFSNIESAEFDKVNEVLAGISMTRANNGFSPRETAYFVLSLKDAVTPVLERNISDARTLYAETAKFNKLVDSLGLVTIETFIKGREEIILRQTAEISEISTPVIQVWDGILALPIIGTLDSARTQVVMESLLLKIVDTESTIAILDISGVPAVDSLVAQHLIKTVAATRLMGAECIISGIRPEIAQTIVHLGIDLSNINTKASLAHALRTAFNMLKLEVRKVNSSNKITALV